MEKATTSDTYGGRLIVFLRAFRGLQAILFLLAGFFLYQSIVFFFHSLRDMHRGENGVTKGLVFLSGGLGLAGLLNVIETAYRFFRTEYLEQ